MVPPLRQGDGHKQPPCLPGARPLAAYGQAPLAVAVAQDGLLHLVGGRRHRERRHKLHVPRCLEAGHLAAHERLQLVGGAGRLTGDSAGATPG